VLAHQDAGFSTAWGPPKFVFPVSVVVNIDHFCWRATRHYGTMKATQKEALAIRCPTCGAKPGEKCELSTGQPRTYPHRDRRMLALDKRVLD
jgi:hypothetical protein